ncbi:LAQU0S03e03466g1_1 [Lachancea quebecensis]|uniref:UDP-N-acetylglucosamine transferase subunit ALG14 n=1 Tax=Lachancea quebecensis TaxID=1654605 RepID=A0A0P1KNM2_9SACH|nr:LAQU0S03e03466g1_1 [Lachancea quebecensis]
MGYTLCLFALIFLQALVVRTLWVVPIFGIREGAELSEKRGFQAGQALRLFVFLGSGGHTGEMLRLLENYRTALLRPGTQLYVGFSDEASLLKFQATVGADLPDVEVKFLRFSKAREVGASSLASVRSVAFSFAQSLWCLTWLKWQFVGQQQLVLLNGPGTCCIIAGWLKFLEIVTLTRSKIVYVESLARTDTLSLSGKLLYPLVDEFVVQWSELCEQYDRARCYGILV